MALGTPVIATAGRGPASLRVHELVGAHHLSVRFSCVGPGAVRLVDKHGGLVLGTGGCSPEAIYGSDFKASAADSLIKLEVAPTVSWKVGIWIK